MNCSGEPFLSSRCPKTTNPNAEWGTECHNFAEGQLKEHLKGNSMRFDHINDVEQRELVKAYCYFVVDKVITPFIHGTDSNEVGIEEKLVIMEDIVWGTGDVTMVRRIAERVDGLVLDLKTGYHDVKVKENSQFSIYGLGLRKKYGITGNITVIGYLPRITEREVPYEVWVMTPADLDRWEADVTKKATKAFNILQGKEAPEFTAGEWCTWCPAQGICPVLNKQLEDEADIMLASAPMEKPFESQVTPVHMLTPAQRSMVLRNKDAIEAYLNSVEALALEDAKAGVKIPGFKLVEGQTKRGWLKADENLIAGELQKLGVKDPWQKKLIGIGEVESQIGKGKIAALTAKNEAKLLLVPESDKRVGIAAAPASANLLTDL